MELLVFEFKASIASYGGERNAVKVLKDQSLSGWRFQPL